MKFNHPLMHNNFTRSDMQSVQKLLKKKNIILTQSDKVREFEKNGQNGLAVNTQYLLTLDLQQII